MIELQQSGGRGSACRLRGVAVIGPVLLALPGKHNIGATGALEVRGTPAVRDI
jgi:hypothetical protein